MGFKPHPSMSQEEQIHVNRRWQVEGGFSGAPADLVRKSYHKKKILRHRLRYDPGTGKYIDPRSNFQDGSLVITH